MLSKIGFLNRIFGITCDTCKCVIIQVFGKGIFEDISKYILYYKFYNDALYSIVATKYTIYQENQKNH